MNLARGNFVHLLAVITIVFAGFSVSHAQSKKQEAAAKRYARNIFVSKIEKGMPQTRFDRWFRRLVRKGMKVTYEVNDCGEQTGTSADKGRDFPMCVEAMADSLDVHISVVLGVGTFKRGIIGTKPDLRGVGFSIEGEGSFDVKKLSDLSASLSKNGVDH